MKKEFVDLTRRALGMLCLILLLAACAVQPPQPWHTFSFDGWFDKWGDQVDLLEYSYGDKYRMTQRAVKPGEKGLGDGISISGPMPVGEFLYVKWRIKKTGEVLDDRVDLRGRLASNMFEHRVTFVIDERQLYVYLVTPLAKHETDPPLLRTTKSRYHVAYEIYPNNTYKN